MASALSGRPVPTLHRARHLVEPVLRKAVGRLPVLMRTPIGYQFGWHDEHRVPITGAGGKGIRPALVLLSAEAVGGTAESAVHAAAAVELVHNFSVVHDDIIDGDTTRRHRPTVWASFGVPLATLAGDALLALAVDVLITSSTGALQSSRELSGALMGLVQGQSADVEFETRAEVCHEEYVTMAEGKTAALFGCACAMGAVAGGGTPEQVHALHRFGHHLGLAFQMVDDLLGIWGDPAVTGKPVRSDLRSRKKTYPVVLTLESDTAAGREFAALYRREGQLSDADVEHAAELIDRTGGRTRTRTEARRHLDAALGCLRDVDPVAAPADEMTAIAHLMLDRDH